MSVVKEWTCFGHGDFEGPDPVCPFGCKGSVKRIFKTAPGIKSRQTRNKDELDKEVAHQLGVTNWSNRNGTVASSTQLHRLTPEQQKAREHLEGYERQYVADRGGHAPRLKFREGQGVLAGKEVPDGPITVALPAGPKDKDGKATFNRALLPSAMPGSRTNNLTRMPMPRLYTRTMNRKDDPDGRKGL
jgi:hypothetical protein